ncbi:MAG: STM3941 family protein [Rudaea sp.]
MDELAGASMATGDETVIELSKVKIVLLIVSAIIFATVGLWMATAGDATLLREARYFAFSATGTRFMGIAGFVFFSACCVIGIYKFFDKQPGLILDAKGFVDNACGISAGLARWAEVTQVQTFQVARQKMLVVMVADPQRYMRRGNSLSRAAKRTNFNLCGSPIAISANTLKCDFSELQSVFDRYLHKYGNAHGNSE